MLQSAIKAVSSGLSLIPVSIKWNEEKSKYDKFVRVDWKEYQTRIASPVEVARWHNEFGNENFRYGIVTGPISKVFILDVEKAGIGYTKDKEGLGTMRLLSNRGYHYYFKWVPELDLKVTNKAGINEVEGLDVRGQGGYAVLWDIDSVVGGQAMLPPPQWLLDLLPYRDVVKTNLVPRDADWIEQTFSGIVPGDAAKGRHRAFLSVIGKLHQKGLKIEETRSVLKLWAEKFDYVDSFNKLLEDIYKRYKQPDEPKTELKSESVSDFLNSEDKVEWLIPGIIPKASLGFIAGLPETGKTWIAMDMAVEMCLEEGKWLGKFPVKECKVLFIDQERFKGETKRRFNAIIDGKGINKRSLDGKLFIQCGSTIRLDLQNSYDAFRKYLMEHRPDLVIVDSFVTFHTREENNRKDIQEVLERIKTLRNELGCAFIFIDHENKSAFQDKEDDQAPTSIRMAGSIAKPAAAEVVFTVRKHDAGSSFVYHTKSTSGAAIEPFLAKVEDLSLDKSKIRVYAE